MDKSLSFNEWIKKQPRHTPTQDEYDLALNELINERVIQIRQRYKYNTTKWTPTFSKRRY